ncbi:MAG: hypothetical protein ABJC36_08190 [Gemmatimonadales bacterium]
MPSTRVHAALISLVLSLAPSGLPAQWGIATGVRAPRFTGGAVEPATGRSLRPYRPTMWEIELDRTGRRVGVGLRLNYASSSLAFEGEDALTAVKDALEIYGIDPELSVRVSRFGADGVLRLYAGPLVEVWKLPDVGSHLRVGIGGSVGLEVPLGGRWVGSARVGGAVTPSSPFTQKDLDSALEPRALWRREASAALRYRL